MMQGLAMAIRFSCSALVALLVCSALSAEPARMQFDCPSTATCLAWSPKGDWLAVGTLDGSVYILDTAAGKESQKIATGQSLLAVAWSPDGKTLAVSQSDQGISS